MRAHERNRSGTKLYAGCDKAFSQSMMCADMNAHTTERSPSSVADATKRSARAVTLAHMNASTTEERRSSVASARRRSVKVAVCADMIAPTVQDQSVCGECENTFTHSRNLHKHEPTTAKRSRSSVADATRVSDGTRSSTTCRPKR
jgi:hypothetical protein